MSGRKKDILNLFIPHVVAREVLLVASDPLLEGQLGDVSNVFGTSSTLFPKTNANLAVFQRPPTRLVFVTRRMAPTKKVSFQVHSVRSGLAVLAIHRSVKIKKTDQC